MKSLLIGLLFFYCGVTFSQGIIRGTVHNHLHHPVPFASVSIDGEYTNCDDQGGYKLILPKEGTFKIASDAFGYLHFEDSLFFFGRDTVVDIHLNPDVVELDSIVLVVKKDVFFKKNEVTQSTAISKETLNEERSSSLVTTLESVTGVNAVSVSSSVTKPVIRGLQHYRLAVIEDHVTQEGQQWGDDHGLELNSFVIEKLTVYKGITGLKYNSGVGGSIVATRFIPLPRDDHKASAQFNFESVNNTIGTDVGVQGNTAGLLYKFTYSTSKYQDYKVPATSYKYLGFVLPIEKNKLANTSGFNNHFYGLLGVKGKQFVSTISYSRDNQTYGLFSGAEGVPRIYKVDVSDPIGFELPFRKAIHQKVISNTIFSFDKAKLRVDVAFQHNERKEYENPLAHGFVEETDTIGIHLKLKTYSANFTYEKFYEKAHLTVGSIAMLQSNEKLKGFDHFVPSYQSNKVGGFASYKRLFSKRFTMSLGYRFDHFNSTVEKSIRLFYYNGNEKTVISPNEKFNYAKVASSAILGASYQLGQTNIKASVKHFARMPTIAELGANGNHHGVFRFERGNKSLSPEKGISLNSSVTYSHHKIKLIVSPYYTYFQNYIYLSPKGVFPTREVEGELYPYVDGGQLYQYKETNAIHYGVEARISWDIVKGVFTSLEGEYLNAKDINKGINLPFIPQNTIKHTVKLTTKKVLDKSYIKWRNNWYEAKENVSQNELKTPSFYRADVFVGTLKKTKIGEFDLSIQLKNVFNRNYFLHLNPLRRLGIPEPARNFSFQLVWKFYHHKHHDE